MWWRGLDGNHTVQETSLPVDYVQDAFLPVDVVVLPCVGNHGSIPVCQGGLLLSANI